MSLKAGFASIDWGLSMLIPTRPSGAGTISGWIRCSGNGRLKASLRLSAARCPLLAVQGLDDEYGTLEQVYGISRRVAQAEIVELARCGHSPHRDQTQKLIRVTTDFMLRMTACYTPVDVENHA